MKNHKVQLVAVGLLLIAGGLLLIPSITRANPKGIPAWKDTPDQRDGYSQTFIIEENGPLIKVPEGRCYVMLRLYARASDNESPYADWEASLWTLTIDQQLFLDEFALWDPATVASGVYVGGILKQDFPDQCVVVRGGQTLGVRKPDEVELVSMTLIGYFCDAP